MAKDKEYYLQGLVEYIRQGEPQKQERGRAWQTAIGLQEADGLKTSPYLLDTARKHIEGDFTIADGNTLTEQIVADEKLDKMQRQIAVLENKMKKENNPNASFSCTSKALN